MGISNAAGFYLTEETMSSYAFDLIKEAGEHLTKAGDLVVKASQVSTLETSLRCSIVINALTHELKRMNDLMAHIDDEDRRGL